MSDAWATDLTEQMRLLASLALRREIGGDEELSTVNEELQTKLDQDLKFKEQEAQARLDFRG